MEDALSESVLTMCSKKYSRNSGNECCDLFNTNRTDLD